MSNETKNKTAADIVAENLQSIAKSVKDNAASAEDIAQAAATVGAVQAKPDKPKAKVKAAADSGASILKAVGLEACRRHRLAQTWVTSDGQVFPREYDARAHAKNLPNQETLKVSAK